MNGAERRRLDLEEQATAGPLPLGYRELLADIALRSYRWGALRLQGDLPWIVRGLSLTAFFVAWEIYGRSQDTTLFFVPFTDVVRALVDQVQTNEFWDAWRQTLEPFIYGWLLALGLGIPIGLLCGRFLTVGRAASPYLAFLNALPVSTLVPVVVVAFGIGMTAKITVVFLFAIVEVILNTAVGVRYVNPELIEMARSFGAREWKLFRSIILPGSLPGIMAGVRIGTGRAVVGMVVVELLLVSVGLGRLIGRYRGRFQSEELYAVVLSLAIFGVLLLEIVRMVERRALRYRPDRGGVAND